jgi:hypothetical protein
MRIERARKTLVPITLAIALVALGARSAVAQTQAEASRVRILLVSDQSGDALEKQRRAATLRGITSALQSALRKQGLARRSTLDVLDRDVTPKTVLDYYRRLDTGPTETLLFYANAHGKTDPKCGHYLRLGSGSLFRADLRAAMALRRPRLIVLLTDTCADVPGEKAYNSKSGKLPRKAVSRSADDALVEDDGPILPYLLLRHRGVVDVNAARKGFYSWGDALTGDYFTRALGKLLNQPASRFTGGQGRPTWRDFYRALDEESNRIAGYHRVYQPSEAFSLAKAAGVPQGTALIRVR